MAPADSPEAEEATKAIYKHHGTCYLRLGRGGEGRIHEKIEGFQIGRSIKIADGDNTVVFTTGAIADEVALARDLLQRDHGIDVGFYTFPTVKPIDRDTIVRCAERYKYIVTVEEHNIVGGFGSAVSEVLAEMKTGCRQIRIGLNDTYSGIVGSQSYLRKYYRISSDDIIERICGTLL
jgi:transketolase